MKLSKLALGLGLALAMGATANAQEDAAKFPEKNVVIIVPYSPGGGSDNVSRAMAHFLAQEWGKSVVVENKPGADGLIATNETIRAKPDGYTLLVSIPAIAMLKHTNKSLKVDPLTQLTPVSMMATGPTAIVVKGKTDIKTVADYKRHCAIDANNCSWASGEPFTLMVGTGLMSSLGLSDKVTNVRYGGTSAAVGDVIGGHVTSLVTGTSSVLAAHKSGDLRILAVSADKRLAELPDVPTYAEAGLSDAKFTNNWYGIFAPAGTPEAIKKKIADGFHKAANAPEVLKVLKPLLLSPVGSSPEEFSKQLAEDQKIIDASAASVFAEKTN
ncbi:tripartite tricarboxylate transporter substrate binding protein [Alcaligenaceae bacterium]|nr:tripartite tricarboxylate transporter substrate binding protein [Alcaligenaceae bacterium]